MVPHRGGVNQLVAQAEAHDVLTRDQVDLADTWDLSSIYPTEPAWEDDFARLDLRLQDLEQAPTQQEFREAGYAFHMELARVTRNPLLIRIFELIIEARAAAGWGRLRSLNDTPEARKSQAESNRRILTALRDRDSETARRLLRAHFGRMVAGLAFQPED